MSKRRVITVAFGVIFSLTLAASSVSADAINSDRFSPELSSLEHRALPDFNSGEEFGYLFSGAQSNGKHLGFSVAAVHQGPRLGLVGRKPNHSSVTENPEPATMLLLGTGVVGLASALRRRRKV